MDERISIIIPVYNMKPYINDCLDSVLRQTYRNLEIILIDDGSTDGSECICDKYAACDPRIRVIHQRNQGLVMARKRGLEAASARYVGFVDSDDWIDEEMYAYLYERITDSGAQVVTTGRFVEMDVSKKIPDNIESGLYYPLKDEYFCTHMIFGENRLIWGITPNFWNKLFEKEHLKKWEALVNSKITYGEDDACVYPCMAFANSVYVSDRCFYHYRMRQTSMSNSADDQYFLRINLLYLTLKRAFEKHPLAEILLRELGVYMFEFALRGINDLWGIQTDISIPRHWLDVSGLFRNKRILLYGAGLVGKDYYRQLCFLGLKNQIVWTDRNGKELREKGYPIISLNEVDFKSVDKIIIAIGNEQIVAEVVGKLKKLGVNEEIIYWNEPRKVLEQTFSIRGRI